MSSPVSKAAPSRRWKIKAILIKCGPPITALPGLMGRISVPKPLFGIHNIHTRRPLDTAPVRARLRDAGVYPLCRSAQGRRKPESRVNPVLVWKRGWIMIGNVGRLFPVSCSHYSRTIRGPARTHRHWRISDGLFQIDPGKRATIMQEKRSPC